ncbi:MAG TPA: carboxypeptidase regulatory-like domain-containing protein [Paludibaculum sp.]
MLRVLSVTALVALCSLPASAQVLYGSIVGTVEDPTGAVVPGASITLTNPATGATRESQADDQGRYTVPNVQAGLYSLKVTKAGFRSLTRTGVEISINTVTRVDAKLEVGQIAEQVTVSASTVALQTDKSDVRSEIASSAITSMPLYGYRNYQQLINLVPGATPAGFQNAVVDTPGRALTTNVNGTARNTNNTLTDGAVNINVWLPHHTAYVQPAESIETVNISTNSFDAEQGMAGGAAITVATKSGTNDLHGVGFWFHNNQHLNTAPYFRSATYKLPLTIFNQGGGTIGGPIKKDKLFYFFSYERTSERTGYDGNYSVAPQAMRDGDFSQWTALGVVYDPATAPMTNAAGRTPFAGNIVPKSRFNPIFPNIYKDVPLPNQKSPTDLLYNLGGNYYAAGVLKLDRNQYDVKINYAASSKLAIWGKYSRMDAPVAGKYIFGDLGGPALGSEGFGDTTTQIPTVGYNYTFSPSFFMDGVFGYTRMDQVVGIPNVDKNIGLDLWKIPGTNGGRQYAKDDRYGGAPQVDGFGFSYVGVGATWAPVWRAERGYTYQTNFSRITGAHEFRWGFEARRLEMNHWQPETANPRGYIGFSSGTTIHPTLNTGQRGSPNSFAGALLGLVNNYSKSIQNYEMKTREWQFAGYFRDRWQISRKLTLNLGLRYEYYPLINRDDRGIERWDPYTNIVYFGGVGGTPRNAGITVSKKLFAPRLGFAYRIGEKNVVRAGYGITYDAVPFGRPLRGLYPSTLTGGWNSPVTTYGWYNTVDQGIPDIVAPDTSKGQALLPVSMDMGPRSPWGGQIHRGYIQSWNFTVERKLPWSMIGSVGYVATNTVRQLLDRNINTVGPGLGTTTANLPLAKLYGKTIGANMWDGIGYATYNSLQATLNKNFSGGLFLKSAFTWGKALNMADDTGWAGLWGWNWEPMMSRNYGYAGYDRKFMYTQAWVYEMPFGKGKKFAMSGVADAILGGWRVNGIFSAYTGTPFYISGSGSSLQCIGCTQTAEQIGEFKVIGKKGPQQPYFEPSAFRDPLFWQRQTGEFKPGSTGKLPFHGPGFWQLDPALFKSFRITERVNMEFRAESTNVAHNARWNNPSGSSASQQLNADGSLNTSVADPLRGFSTITGATSTRQFRFGLRLAF